MERQVAAHARADGVVVARTSIAARGASRVATRSKALDAAASCREPILTMTDRRLSAVWSKRFTGLIMLQSTTRASVWSTSSIIRLGTRSRRSHSRLILEDLGVADIAPQRGPAKTSCQCDFIDRGQRVP